MTIYFKRFVLPPSTGYVAQADWDGCWKIYSICASENRNTCTTNADIQRLSAADKKAALSSYVNFLNRAHTGQNLTVLYDEKRCHEAHSFSLNGETEKIFRIWGTGVIRIYFLYLPEKVILILKTWPKRKDKLTAGEISQLENMARLSLECLLTDNFSTRVI